MKKPLIFGVILAVVVGIPVAKKLFTGEKLKQVTVEQAQLQDIKASILASGQLKHQIEVKLSSEVIGKVAKLYVDEGERVEAGQVVLEIDDETFVASVELQQAAVDQQKIAIEKQIMIVSNLKQQWLRKTELYKQKLLDTDAYDAITHQYKVSKVDLKGQYEQLKQVKARLQQADDQLSKTKVLSPINGIITSLDIKQGETAISGTTNIVGSSLMTIADPSTMLAEVNVDEADISHVEIGQKAEIISIAYADTPLAGIVESIASSAKTAAGRQSLSFAVKLKLLEPKQIALRPGMSCRAEIFTQGEQSLLAVPIRAIQIEEDNDADQVESFVFVVKQGIAKKVKINTGISDDSFQQITTGIEKGDQIVTGPGKILRYLKDGDKVTIDDKLADEKAAND